MKEILSQLTKISARLVTDIPLSDIDDDYYRTSKAEVLREHYKQDIKLKGIALELRSIVIKLESAMEA